MGTGEVIWNAVILVHRNLRDGPPSEVAGVDPESTGTTQNRSRTAPRDPTRDPLGDPPGDPPGGSLGGSPAGSLGYPARDPLEHPPGDPLLKSPSTTQTQLLSRSHPCLRRLILSWLMCLVSQRYLAPCNVSIDRVALFCRPAAWRSRFDFARFLPCF